ncbi:hypothetical protein PAMA_018526 [Pampus argenteus]
MGHGDMLTAKSGRKKLFSFSPFRWRQQAAKERRFCILWINRMVNKQVEKLNAELQLEFLLMKRYLREEMLTALHEQLRQLVEEETEERSVYHIKLNQEKRMTSRRLREMNEDYKDNTKEDKEHSASRNMLDVSGDDDTSDISNDDGSQLAKCEQEEPPLISSDFAETKQLMKASVRHEKEEEEEEISKSNANLVERTNEEEALLAMKQWKEWMDKQEMKVNQEQVKPSDQQISEKQGEAALPVSEKQMRQNTKGGETLWKIRTYLNGLLNPSHKWERFEDED